VERCILNQWIPTGTDCRRSGGSACTPGDSKCGADGYVQRCLSDGTWGVTATRCQR
jgi:hypothetical protein